MMKKLKVNVKIIDKHKIFDAKGNYDPETRLLEVKKRVLSRDILRFIVDPDHIYQQVSSRNRYVVFVDNAKRVSIPISRNKVEGGESVQVHSNEDVNLKIANQLDYHTERSFWKALMEAHKIPLSTLLITAFAGMGVYLILVTVLRACGIHV